MNFTIYVSIRTLYKVKRLPRNLTGHIHLLYSMSCTSASARKGQFKNQKHQANKNHIKEVRKNTKIYSHYWKPLNSQKGPKIVRHTHPMHPRAEAVNQGRHAQSFFFFSQFRSWEDGSDIWNPNKFYVDEKLRKKWTIESVPVSAKSLSDGEVFRVEVAGRSVHVDVHFRLETTSFPYDFRRLELAGCLNPRKLKW